MSDRMHGHVSELRSWGSKGLVIRIYSREKDSHSDSVLGSCRHGKYPCRVHHVWISVRRSPRRQCNNVRISI